MLRQFGAVPAFPINGWLRASRFVLLLVSLLGVFSVGAQAAQGAHCARHGASMEGASGHQAAHQHGSAAWQHRSHECPHCPASECARLTPCAASNIGVVPATVVNAVMFTPRSESAYPVRLRLSSTSHQPPTPPPQAIA